MKFFEPTPDDQPGTSILPNFCRWPVGFAAVVMAQLVVLLIAIGGSGFTRNDFVLASLFSQWLALWCICALCGLRSTLASLSTRSQMGLSYLTLLAMTAGGAALAGWVDRTLALSSAQQEISLLQFVATTTLLSGLVSAAALRYFFMQRQWAQNVQSHARAELRALQARIRPHFLFNALNTIASLVQIRPAEAEEAIEDLSELFRAALAETRDLQPLADELELCRQYLAIEKHRLGERLIVDWDVEPQAESMLLPPLVLQPLVENAIYHGIQQLPQGGTLGVTARRERGKLCLEVINPIVDGGSRSQGLGFAQRNIRQRLELRYGREAMLEIQPAPTYYRVRVEVPVLTDASVDR